MATYTENYNLKKPEPNDFYDIQDFNDNADIIDQTLKANSNSIKANDYARAQAAVVTGGTGLSLTATADGFTYTDMSMINIKLHTDIENNATLNVNNLGSRPIYLSNNNRIQSSASGSIISLVYNANALKFYALGVIPQDYVKKSGDTISGDLVISSGQLKYAASNYGAPIEAPAYIDMHKVNSTNDFDLRLSVNGSTNQLRIEPYGAASGDVWHSGNFTPLGFTPVQQGGGAAQNTNKVYIGWGNNVLRYQVDSTDFGQLFDQAYPQIYFQSTTPNPPVSGNFYGWAW